MERHLTRALALIDQSRYDLAEPELRQALAADPDNGMAHAYLAMCLCARDEFTPATDEAQNAIRLAPEWPFAHHVLGRVYLRRNRFEEADAAAQEALRLDPHDPNHFALVSNIALMRKDWGTALSAAEQGLALDAEHVDCNNSRAMALRQLGRRAEAGATLAATLARAPEDAFSHANNGWNELHNGNTKKALEHFREALRLQPNLDYARAGMVEALKARHWIYGLMLKYFLFMERLGPRLQWAIIIGAYLIYRGLGALAEGNPQWAPYVWPVLIAYLAFAIMSWIAAPLFNLLLRLNRFGRYALSPDQTWGANLVGLLLLAALAALGVWIATTSDVALVLTIYFGFLLLPSSAIFVCERGWPRNWMIAYTLALAALLPAFLLLERIDPDLATLAAQAFIFGAFLSGFVANYLMMSQVRH